MPLENFGPQHRPGPARPAVVSFEQAPPIAVPMRFFLAASMFGVAAALVVLVEGTGIWISRWSVGTLALTHLMTLGFLAMVMAGSLMQILPVVAGAPVRQALIVSGTVHALLGLGTLALADGFLFGHAWMLRLAIMLLAAAFVVFIGVVADSLCGMDGPPRRQRRIPGRPHVSDNTALPSQPGRLASRADLRDVVVVVSDSLDRNRLGSSTQCLRRTSVCAGAWFRLFCGHDAVAPAAAAARDAGQYRAIFGASVWPACSAAC